MIMEEKKMEFAEGFFRSNFKIVIAGDGGVGKTAIIQNLLGEKFSKNYLLTIGCDITTYKHNHKGQILSLQLWDLAGQQRFDVVRNLYYGGARAAILVFDLTRDESFLNLEKWKEEIFLHAHRKIPILVLGNKVDLDNSQFLDSDPVFSFIQSIDAEYEQEFKIDKLKVSYLTTSALTGENVKEAFQILADILLTHQRILTPL